ncbi:M42 family metallopeptidase [uncultured Akkermansia sp.]|uniref:M42 family metallopeptidase n=1 Tax=uncultured Akkermansia sp. TaxID=512294 RepID=UPI0025EB875C|nr:M42 family metallopeptidase [uncultured Akkermansia sp.]
MAIDSELLGKFSEAHGISGHEDEVRNLVARELAGCGEFSSDGSGCLFCANGNSGPRVMLAAHMDEIGFLVQNITGNGFLQLVGIGGWWPHTLLSQRVLVKTRSGRSVQGVIGSKPPHFLPEGQRNSVMSMEALFVDVGAENAEQARNEFGIHLGDPVVPDVKFTSLENPFRVMGKAFDNRAGLSVMIEAFKTLCREGHPNTLIAAATVQEEVGTRGARTAGVAMRPDCVIVLEGPPADDTPGFTAADSQGALGGGVQIRLFDPTAITNPRLAALAEEVAEKAGIPFQLTVRRSGGTDAGALHLSGKGVPCIVLGIPTRYIHAHNGVLDLRDYRAAVELTVALARALDHEAVEALTHYLP